MRRKRSKATPFSDSKRKNLGKETSRARHFIEPKKDRLENDRPTTSDRKKSKKPRADDVLDNGVATNAKIAQADHVLDVAKTLLSEGLQEGELPFSQSYFRAREGSRSGKWSGKKISDIDLVDEQDLRAALSKVTPKHAKELAALLESYKTFYAKWHFQLSCGFGLIMYGFGSKKGLLEDFASSTLTDGAAIVVNGYLPTINIKQVVFTLADTVWEQCKSCTKSSYKSSKLIGDRPLSSHSMDELIGFLNNVEGSCHVYLIIHNIEGPGLRYIDVQQALSDIAACSQVRLLASIDHVNAPLLWDKQMANTKFNWWWHHTPTYAPYTYEAMHLPLILASSGTAKSLRSAILVLQSLTPNAQSVFRILAEYQLSHSEEQGLPVHKLYTLCREHFLVSSELTLKAHLTEFKDHELVRSRRGLDGQDCLYIPLPSDALVKLIEDANDS